jgi:hypothetical protein
VTITFTGSLGDRKTAVQRSGTLEGGGAVTFDVPETELGALAALLPLARVPLRITVEVDTETATAPQQEETADAGEEPDKPRPAWAGQRKRSTRK